MVDMNGSFEEWKWKQIFAVLLYGGHIFWRWGWFFVSGFVCAALEPRTSSCKLGYPQA